MPFVKIVTTNSTIVRNHDFSNNDMMNKPGPVHQRTNLRFGLNVEVEKSVTLLWMSKIEEAKSAEKLETSSLENHQIKTATTNEVRMQEAFNINPETYKDSEMVRDYLGLTKVALELQKSEIDELETKIQRMYQEYLLLKDILGGQFSPEL